MFNRLTDVLTFYLFDRWSYALTMLYDYSFDRRTDGPLRIIFGRLTNGTYSTYNIEELPFYVYVKE